MSAPTQPTACRIFAITDLWFEATPEGVDLFLSAAHSMLPDRFMVSLFCGFVDFWRLADIKGRRVFTSRPPRGSPFPGGAAAELIHISGPLKRTPHDPE